MQSFITLKSGKFRGHQVSLQVCSVVLERQQTWPSPQWLGKGKFHLQKRPKRQCGELKASQPYCDLLEKLWTKPFWNTFLDRWREVAWKCIFASLKFLLCQLNCTKSPVLLRSGSYYICAAYIMNTLVIQKLEVGGIRRRAVGSSIFIIHMIILHWYER